MSHSDDDLENSASGSESDGSVDIRELQALHKLQGKSTAARDRVNNTVGLKQSLQSFVLPAAWPWIERATVTSTEPLELEDVHDDLKREAAFYQRTLQNVKQSLVSLEASGVPYKRPADFYAEMVKSDAHMTKVKDVLLSEKKRMKATEERRKQQNIKKFSKQVHVQRVQERAKEKRAQQDAIAKWRKDSKHNEISVERPDLDDMLSGSVKVGENGGEQQKRSPSKKPKVNYKRKMKDEKYGFGGQKRNRKENNAKSAGDMSGYNLAKNRRTDGFVPANKAKAGSKRPRPGKARRSQSRGAKRAKS